MKHINRTKKSSLSADKHKIKINLGDDLPEGKMQALLVIIDEIVDKLGREDGWHGTFSFSKDSVEFKMESDHSISSSRWRL